MAQQYLMRHPDGVRSVVLDSVAPNELALGEDFAGNLENALKAQFLHMCTNAPRAKKHSAIRTRIYSRCAISSAPSRKTIRYRDPVTFKTDTMQA